MLHDTVHTQRHCTQYRVWCHSRQWINNAKTASLSSPMTDFTEMWTEINMQWPQHQIISYTAECQKEWNSASSGEGNGDAKEKILKKCPNCFRGVGLFSGEYQIDLKQDAEPVIHPPRRIPESIKDVVKKELKRMIILNNIEKIGQPTDWVSSGVY